MVSNPPEVLPLVDGRYPRRFTDFKEFIESTLAVSAQIRDPEDLRIIAEAFAHAQAKQNIIYTETTFTAITHVRLEWIQPKCGGPCAMDSRSGEAT
jgi:hypothetical protein